MVDDKDQAVAKTEDNGEPKPNRKVKDSVFVDLFGRDIHYKENFISLYNALHGSSLSPKDTEVKPEMVESAVYMSYANDVAMQVGGNIVVLVEHQSTINRNMPLRILIYLTRILDRIVPGKDKFRRTMVKIPAPEFYVLYNGRDDYPEKSEMRLSDAFSYPKDTEKPKEVPLELVVKVYNINPGKGDKLLAKCETLRQYSQFIELVRYAHDNAEKEHIERPQDWAVKEAIRRGILPEYLERKASEVMNMLDMEYDYELDLTTRWEEGHESGLKEGHESGLKEGLEKGHENGLKEGHESGMKEGLETGRIEGLLESIQNLMESLNMSDTEAMTVLKIPAREHEKYAEMLAESARPEAGH